MDDVCIGMLGTRDSFGVGKEFYDHKTKKYIDNYKSWKRAGFEDVCESPRLPEHMRKLIKDKAKRKPKERPVATQHAQMV